MGKPNNSMKAYLAIDLDIWPILKVTVKVKKKKKNLKMDTPAQP